MKEKFISKKMNRMLHSIHKRTVHIYKKNKQYYSIDQDIYIYKGVFDFQFIYQNNRMVILINKDYLNYILKAFRSRSIDYCLICINHGYDQILWYHNDCNHYDTYYQKGKRIVKNEKAIETLTMQLKRKNDINLLKKVDEYFHDCYP